MRFFSAPRAVMGAFLALLALLAFSISPAEAQREMQVVNAVPVMPTPLHYAIWDMVEGCANAYGYETQAQIQRILIADQLIVVDEGVLAYGIARWEDGVGVAVIEKDYFLHPAVLSHEFLHIISGLGDGEMDDLEARCQMRIPGGLPVRRVLPPEIESVG